MTLLGRKLSEMLGCSDFVIFPWDLELGFWDFRCALALPGIIFVAQFAGVRFPKIAVPTRTSVAPSSIATGKSSLIPMESCGNLTWNCVDN